jgi:hypothetical protein
MKKIRMRSRKEMVEEGRMEGRKEGDDGRQEGRGTTAAKKSTWLGVTIATQSPAPTPWTGKERKEGREGRREGRKVIKGGRKKGRKEGRKEGR